MMKHKHGGDIYHYAGCLDFSANCNPLGTPEGVKAAIRDSAEAVSHYPEVGCGPLKAAIAAYEEVPETQIICGNGAADLIFSLCRAKNPKKALVLAPTFAEYEQALDSVGCQVEHYGLNTENFQVEEAYFQALKDDLDIVFLCNPNNPTGILLEREFLLHVLRICREKQIFLVVDECFLDFVREPEAYTLKAKLPEYQNLFLLKAFTKRYTMAGVRLGYGICSDRELLDRMEQMTQPWNVSVVAQAAGLAALKETAYLEAGRQMVFQENEYLRAELDALGMQVYPSEANYIFFRGPEKLFDLCAEKGILIRDCSNYPGLGSGYYRVAVKNPEENGQLIRVLKAVMAEIAAGAKGTSDAERTAETTAETAAAGSVSTETKTGKEG